MGMMFEHTVTLDFKDTKEHMAFVKTFNWCQTNIGVYKFDWDWDFGANGTFDFRFCKPESATAFALRWV
jgi:hypothetical protein